MGWLLQFVGFVPPSLLPTLCLRFRHHHCKEQCPILFNKVTTSLDPVKWCMVTAKPMCFGVFTWLLVAAGIISWPSITTCLPLSALRVDPSDTVMAVLSCLETSERKLWRLFGIRHLPFSMDTSSTHKGFIEIPLHCLMSFFIICAAWYKMGALSFSISCLVSSSTSKSSLDCWKTAAFTMSATDKWLEQINSGFEGSFCFYLL